MATLNLPDSPRTLVWRLVKDRLKADAALAASGVALEFAEGDRDFTADGLDGGLTLFFVATAGPMGWFDERSQSGALIISYWCVLKSLDDEDALNLQGAIEQSLYPIDAFAFHQSLVDAGAVTGQPVFDQPLQQAAASAGKDGLFRCAGRFTIAVASGFAP